ncbi:MAG: mechanosensitive ion channel family protein [Opitutus sp.]|nr:mechanosensitive ion channel family protein [Opitutus sp.]MCS6247909.1 mechanosensitive ion channel family protein [Opitutus sp.]MCS6275491.1 mechanosensitive ion channel family protein [Opitutus sp.]MCS6276980.1 mechanosensitive ion channel family protein [Opitutus sp.]MCS6299972.1 mechanosensitive ion channel family protein [Opitutus sp.]
MKHVRAAFVFLVLSLSSVWSQTEAPATADTTAQSSTAASAELATQAAAALAYKPHTTPATDYLEQLVDAILALFHVRSSGNTWQHYAIAATLLVAFYLLRRVVTHWIFGFLKKLASRTSTTFDDKLFPALETPAATFIALLGLFAAIKVLKLPAAGDDVLKVAMTVAFSVCFFWTLLRTLNAFLDHLAEVAQERQAGVAAFMPWIKKALVTLFVVLGALMIAQSLGANVKAFLAGLGIGGLAFALAAQDTIANLFGSVVVAIDQPFKLGETVKIGAFTGTVEDIGLRSTKLRAVDKSLIVLPNKMVASEVVTNLARFLERRVEQVLGLTYDTSPEQMEAIVEDFRQILLAEAEIDPATFHVYFRDYSASSIDLWVVYIARDPDFTKHMKLRQRINLAFMRAVQARGLSFAYPTQTLELSAKTTQALAQRQNSGA